MKKQQLTLQDIIDAYDDACDGFSGVNPPSPRQAAPNTVWVPWSKLIEDGPEDIGIVIDLDKARTIPGLEDAFREAPHTKENT